MKKINIEKLKKESKGGVYLASIIALKFLKEIYSNVNWIAIRVDYAIKIKDGFKVGLTFDNYRDTGINYIIKLNKEYSIINLYSSEKRSFFEKILSFLKRKK